MRLRCVKVRATWIKNTKKMSFDEDGIFNLLDIQVGGEFCVLLLLHNC